MPVHHIQEVQALESHSNRRPMSTIYQQIRFNSPKRLCETCQTKTRMSSNSVKNQPTQGQTQIYYCAALAEGSTSTLHRNAPSPQSKKQMQSGPLTAIHAPPNNPSDEEIGALIVRCSLKFLKIFTLDKDSRMAKSPVPTCKCVNEPKHVIRCWNRHSATDSRPCKIKCLSKRFVP